eukprot:IDg3879t1
MAEVDNSLQAASIALRWLAQIQMKDTDRILGRTGAAVVVNTGVFAGIMRMIARTESITSIQGNINTDHNHNAKGGDSFVDVANFTDNTKEDAASERITAIDDIDNAGTDAIAYHDNSVGNDDVAEGFVRTPSILNTDGIANADKIPSVDGNASNVTEGDASAEGTSSVEDSSSAEGNTSAESDPTSEDVSNIEEEEDYSTEQHTGTEGVIGAESVIRIGDVASYGSSIISGRNSSIRTTLSRDESANLIATESFKKDTSREDSTGREESSSTESFSTHRSDESAHFKYGEVVERLLWSTPRSGGFNNQLISIYEGIRCAQLLGRTLVLPLMFENVRNDTTTKGVGPFPFEDYFNVEALSAVVRVTTPAELEGWHGRHCSGRVLYASSKHFYATERRKPRLFKQQYRRLLGLDAVFSPKLAKAEGMLLRQSEPCIDDSACDARIFTRTDEFGAYSDYADDGQGYSLRRSMRLKTIRAAFVPSLA